MASRSIERAEAPHLRAWLRIGAIVLTLMVLIGPHLVWRLFDRQSPIAGLFLKITGWIVGADVTVTGTPTGGHKGRAAHHSQRLPEPALCLWQMRIPLAAVTSSPVWLA